MTDASDVIVVGGGPCGSYAAYHLAQLGVDVKVFEEHDQIGLPSHCAGHLSIKSLKRLGLWPLPSEIVENTFRGATFHSPGGKEFSVRFPSPVTCTVQRSLFDQHLAKLAEGAGADFSLGSRVESLIVENDRVIGVRIREGDRMTSQSAEVVIDAEGVSSRILRQAVPFGLRPRRVVNAVLADVDDVELIVTDMVEVFLGNDYSSGLFVWLIPKKDGKVKVGLATKSGNPLTLLQRFMREHPAGSRKLGRSRVQRMGFHAIPLGGPIDRTYANGFLTVGDAASHVKPTTGGGMTLGMTCARIAAEVVRESLNKGDFSAGSLSAYQKRWQQALGFDLKMMLRIRKMLDRMSDRQVDNLVDFCQRYGLGDELADVEDIDLQGWSLLRLMRRPAMLVALLHFLRLGIFTNP